VNSLNRYPNITGEFLLQFLTVIRNGRQDILTPPGWPQWRTTYHFTTSVWKMPPSWHWTGHCGSVGVIGSKQSYALNWCKPNNDEDDGVFVILVLLLLLLFLLQHSNISLWVRFVMWITVDSYMKTFKPASGHMLDNPLQKHHLYPCARSLLVERFPDLIQQSKVTLLLCISTTTEIFFCVKLKCV